LFRRAGDAAQAGYACDFMVSPVELRHIDGQLSRNGADARTQGNEDARTPDSADGAYSFRKYET
jgi:hypothetical protein